ncbi:MAG: SGNH/GDSL hydrolase family protein [Bacteroidota bacterium]
MKCVKWCAVIIFILFLLANIVLTAFGVTSIFFFSVIITVTFLISEAILKIAGCDRNTKGNMRVLISSVFIALIIGEIILRISGKYDSYREQNGDFFYTTVYAPAIAAKLDKKTLIHVFDENLMDLINNAESIKPKPLDEYRIFALGDSFTEGVGSSSDSTWLKLLEKDLNKKIKVKTIKTINAGISGNDPLFEYLILKETLLKHEPDMVIIAVNSSDIDEIIVRGGMERFRLDSTIRFKSGPWFEILFGTSYICRFVVLNVFKYDWLFLSPGERKAEKDKALSHIYSSILMFEELSKKKYFNLLIVFHPLIEEVISVRYDFDELILTLNEETHIPVLDLLDYYLDHENMNRNNVSEYYLTVDKHHNAKGYEAFARGVGKKIRELGWVN